MTLIYSLLTLLTLTTPAAAADLRPFDRLFTDGVNQFGWRGQTDEGRACAVDFSRGAGYVSFFVSVGAEREPRRQYGKFQVGFGHTLSFVVEQDGTLRASSSHRAEEQYSSDTRALVIIELGSSGPGAITIKNETKRFLGYQTDFFEKCVKEGV